MSSHSATASETASLTRISPPSASAATRAAWRDVAAEDVVVAVHDVAVVDADPDQHGGLALAPAALEGLLHRDRAAHRLLRRPERDHEPVALGLDHVAVVPGDRRADRRSRAGRAAAPTPCRRAARCSSVDPSMSENRIATLPSAPAIRVSAGRSTCAQPARSSMELRIAPPNPFSRTRSTVSHIALTASSGVGTSRRGGRRAPRFSRAAASSARSLRWRRRPTSHSVADHDEQRRLHRHRDDEERHVPSYPRAHGAKVRGVSGGAAHHLEALGHGQACGAVPRWGL